MSFTESQVQRESAKFIQRSPSVKKKELADGSEVDSFRRLHDAVMMALGTKPNVLFRLRYLGRNRLLSRITAVATSASSVLIYLDACTRPSVGNPDSSALSGAQKDLQLAYLSGYRGGSSATAQHLLGTYRKKLSKFTQSVKGDATRVTGERARAHLAQALDDFETQYSTLMSGFVTISRDFSLYSPQVIQRRLSLTTVQRAEQSMGLASDFFAGAEKRDAQAKSADYALNLLSASAAIRAVDSFRDPAQPTLRSKTPSLQDTDGVPAGTSFLASTTGPTTPAAAAGTKSTGILPAGSTLDLAVNGGAAVSLTIPGAGQWSLTAGTQPNLSYTSKKLYFQVFGVTTTINLTDNPADLAAILADLNAGLPAGAAATSLAGRIVLTHVNPFTLGPELDSGAAELGLSTGVLAIFETTPEDIELLVSTVAGVQATTETTFLGEPTDDGEYFLGTGNPTSVATFKTDIADLAGAGVQAGDTLVIKEGSSAGRYVISVLFGSDTVAVTRAMIPDTTVVDFYIESRRMTLTSTDQTTGTKVEVIKSDIGIATGEYLGSAQSVVVSGSDGASADQVTADLPLYGVEVGDEVVTTRDGTSYTMKAVSVSGGQVSLEAVDGSPIPSDMSGVPVEIRSPMKARSEELTSRSLTYLKSRRNKFPTSTRPISAFRRDVGAAINNTQLRSRVRRPMEELASLLVSLTRTIPSQADVETAMRSQGLTLPASPSLTMEDALLAYSDTSNGDLVALADAILLSLEERGYDRGRDLLLTGRIQAFADMSPQEASYQSLMLDRSMQIGTTLKR